MLGAKAQKTHRDTFESTMRHSSGLPGVFTTADIHKMVIIVDADRHDFNQSEPESRSHCFLPYAHLLANQVPKCTMYYNYMTVLCAHEGGVLAHSAGACSYVTMRTHLVYSHGMYLPRYQNTQLGNIGLFFHKVQSERPTGEENEISKNKKDRFMNTDQNIHTFNLFKSMSVVSIGIDILEYRYRYIWIQGAIIVFVYNWTME